MYLQACTVCNYVYVCFVYADAINAFRCRASVGRRTIPGASIILAVCYVVFNQI